MKNISNILSIGLFFVILTGCGKDNFDEPTSTLTGKIVYNGEAIQVRGTGEAIQLQLYQDGYALKDPITVYVGQEGTFSAKLFDGEYKLVTRDNNGPWVNSRDTLIVNVKGRTNIEVNVTPYFTISGTQISISGNTMNASLTINRIVSTAEISRVVLVLSKTQFVDDANNIFRKDITGITAGAETLTADLSGNNDVANAKTLYGRVAVHTNGADQAIYSPVVKLK
ncbi:MAG: DUF3823 domain-containing protein [Tannerella sp.]|nr:DUF3823 domain-containing protein [Tannerella sp.]